MASANGEISSDKLIDLRVVDLRNELEKRGLDKTGVKAVLLERLEKALKNGGENLENTEGSQAKSDTVPSKDVTDLVKDEAGSEEKLLEESQPAEDVPQNKLTTDNMDEKVAETSNVALADVFLNITNPDTDSLLPVKPSDNQILSSDTKPSDMLVNDTFDKDQFVEELPVSTSDTNKETKDVLQKESDDPLKDTTAPPEQSSTSADTNTKEENSEMSSTSETKAKGKPSEVSSSAENNKKEEISEKSSSAENTTKEGNGEISSSANVKNATPPQNSNELKGDEVAKKVIADSVPPTPSRVPHKAPFTLKNTIRMDTSTTQQSEENESLIVHVDDTQNDLDADLVSSKANKAKMDKTPTEKVSGKSEVKKTDGSTVDEKAKGKTEGGQTEKKADEKKDDKDVKSKSSAAVSKPKVVKNVKCNNLNSRNLWVSGLASSTRATDLKMLFTKYGKVVGAKIVTNARSPGARCYGFVTMATAHDSSKCIQHLNQTELHGRMISVEKARNEPGAQITKMPETKPAENKVEKPEVKKDEKKDGDKKEGTKKVDNKEPKKDDKNRRISSRRDDKRHTSSSSSTHHRTSDKSRVPTTNRSTGKSGTSLKRPTKEGSEKSTKPSSSTNTKEKDANPQKPKPRGPTGTSDTAKDKSGKDTKKDILSFDQIKKERERQRLRQRRRNLREQERHRITKLERTRMLHDLSRKQTEQKEKALKLERAREELRRERQKLEKELLERERFKLEQEFLERERLREQQHRVEMMRLEEMRHNMKRPYDRSNIREEVVWDEPKRSRMSSSSNPSRFELPFQNESRCNEYEHTDDERHVERYERRENRTLEGGSHFDEHKEREMMRREMDHVRNILDRDERRPDDRSQTDEKLGRMPYELRREMGPSRERYIGPDRGREADRRSISAHDRLGRMRNSPVGGPDQRGAPWGSGSISRKVDNWPHMHRDMDNSGMNRPNDQWLGNNMTPTGRDTSGAFIC